MTTNKNEKRIRKIEGVVISDKMDKTVVVEAVRVKTHPIYKKQYKISKKYKAHDEKNEFKVGDEVIIKETKPISKDKYFVVEKAKEKK